MSALYDRFVERTSGRSDPRPAVEKDRDRLIHSSAFRRLQGKSQIVGVEVGDFFRTRITHSLECAQIGGAIADAVAKGDDWESVVDDPSHLRFVVEAACLAHDLGHPPFGHNGEQALAAKMEAVNDSKFEGNAQSFRIVTYLEPKLYDVTALGTERWVGVNLTRTTLRAIMKYPTREAEADQHPKGKFGVYDDPVDLEYYEWIWDGVDPTATLAAEIMDAADDISYAVHDFEDGVWAGMIPLYDLQQGNPLALERLERKAHKLDEDGVFKDHDVGETVDDLLDRERWDYIAGVGFDRTRWARAELKNVTARLIGELIGDVTPDGRFREPEADAARKITVLKAMAFEWMIERSDLETYKYGQRRLVESIFDGYWRNPEMLPQRAEWEEVRSQTDPTGEGEDQRWPGKAVLIRDHVASMTDGYARDVYDQMYRATQRRDLRLTY